MRRRWSRFALSPGSPGGLLGLRPLRRVGGPVRRWGRAAPPPLFCTWGFLFRPRSRLRLGREAGCCTAWRVGSRADGSVCWVAGELLIVGGQLGARGEASVGVADWCLGASGGRSAVASDHGLSPPLSLPLWLELDDFAAGRRWLPEVAELGAESNVE
ncbi:hypothetical protein NDU88_002171 [Pleurodeles waltl]|uniref:Uncharacterized protein n=1 Tax=Pleurodeles waltl TaxID=8319 RepID=A0AAV7R988_PLEWA|nr:hypothetical protein NDU88_002171 [Pleurodeles waltl]